MTKVIVLGNVPPEVVEEARKMGEEMGVDEVHIGSPEEVMKKVNEVNPLTHELTGRMLINRSDDGTVSREEVPTVGELPPNVVKALVEALGLDKEWEKIPYNGVAGDTCDCPACNARRQSDGPDNGRDARMGIPKGQFKGSPGQDVAGQPMIRMPEAKNPENEFGFLGMRGDPFKTKEEAQSSIEDLMKTIREKQQKHFEMCDKIYDAMSTVKKAIEESNPIGAMKGMLEVDKLIGALKKDKV